MTPRHSIFTRSPGFVAPAPSRGAAPEGPPPAPLDAQRALIATAFSALIDQVLDAPHPAIGADALIRNLTASGLALMTSGPDHLTLELFNIRAPADGRHATSCAGLLRAWQSALRDRLAAGVRA